jgi:hypothetical protein
VWVLLLAQRVVRHVAEQPDGVRVRLAILGSVIVAFLCKSDVSRSENHCGCRGNDRARDRVFHKLVHRSLLTRALEHRPAPYGSSNASSDKIAAADVSRVASVSSARKFSRAARNATIDGTSPEVPAAAVAFAIMAIVVSPLKSAIAGQRACDGADHTERTAQHEQSAHQPRSRS